MLVIVSHLSITHSLMDLFSNDRKGRRVLGVVEGGRERERKERIDEVRVTDVWPDFSRLSVGLSGSAGV